VVYDYYRKWITVAADRLRNTLDQIGEDDAHIGLRAPQRRGTENLVGRGGEAHVLP
jgi:hypothetical protein